MQAKGWGGRLNSEHVHACPSILFMKIIHPPNPTQVVGCRVEAHQNVSTLHKMNAQEKAFVMLDEGRENGWLEGAAVFSFSFCPASPSPSACPGSKCLFAASDREESAQARHILQEGVPAYI